MTTTTNEPGTDSNPVRLQEAAGSVADSAGQAAEKQASRAMIQASESLDQVAQALRDTGNQMRQDRPELANLADTGAERIDQLSSYVREHDVRGVIDDAEQVARRQPAVLIAGGLALGLILGRVLRSGAEPMGQSMGRQWSGSTTQPRRSADDGLTDVYLPSDYQPVGAGAATSGSATTSPSRMSSTSETGSRSSTRSGGSSRSSRSKTQTASRSGS